jgi:hypothetical protein
MRSERGKTALRCAVYTRVSTEHGLEQEFNSLDNQREASEAYIKSQAHEGWKLIRTHYDDGGYSGGSMERPALQKRGGRHFRDDRLRAWAPLRATAFRPHSHEPAQTQRRPPKVMRPAREENMKLIVSSLLVAGLLTVSISEANAVVCARGVYHAGCAGAVGVHRPYGYGGAAVVHRPYGYGGAAVVRPAYGVHRGVRVYR